jgi:hypothetical protein
MNSFRDSQRTKQRRVHETNRMWISRGRSVDRVFSPKTGHRRVGTLGASLPKSCWIPIHERFEVTRLPEGSVHRGSSVFARQYSLICIWDLEHVCRFEPAGRDSRAGTQCSRSNSRRARTGRDQRRADAITSSLSPRARDISHRPPCRRPALCTCRPVAACRVRF